MTAKKLLIIQASSRHRESVSREISALLVEEMQKNQSYEIKIRDLESSKLPLLDETMLGAFFTPQEQQTEEQKQLQAESFEYIEELKWADTLVIASPMYNFSVPARLKAWIDLVCRAGMTFKYTESGPVGLLDASEAYLIVSTGGTPIGSQIDYASSYLQQIMKFIGIEQVELIRADGSKHAREEIIANSSQQISELLS